MLLDKKPEALALLDSIVHKDLTLGLNVLRVRLLQVQEKNKFLIALPVLRENCVNLVSQLKEVARLVIFATAQPSLNTNILALLAKL